MTRTLLAALALAPLAAAQKPPEPKGEPPAVVLALPLAVEPGKTTKLTLRGLRLDAATEFRCGGDCTAKVVGKAAKVAVPMNQPAALHGDTQVEVEVTAPAGLAGPAVELRAVSPAGEGKPHRLIVTDGAPRVAEKEPNDGFKQAQAVPVPCVVEGKIQAQQDVDVFRVEGNAGRRLSLGVQSGRFGTRLDALVQVFDGRGRLLATCDDHDGGPDPVLEVAVPADGAYFVCVSDANDQGGERHVYRLVVREQ